METSEKTSNRWQEIDDVFARALDRPPAERAAFLKEVCSDDRKLRQAVEDLLQVGEQPSRVDRLADELMVPLLGSLREAMLAPPLEPSLEGRAVSHYQVLERLGGGGMGVVYKARDTRLGRTVALKFLPPHLSTDGNAKERFLAEAQAAAALDHPNICTIYEIGEPPAAAGVVGRLFIAMACYEGETLKAKITQGPLEVEEALDLTLQIAQGLAKAHAQDIVHRDIKPANVMVTEDGVAKILDFGVAKRSDVSLTKTGMRMGTVAYMSPEQARGEAVDCRTDCWSLGVVLYEMLTGERPFRGDAEQAILNAIQKEHPQPMSMARMGVPHKRTPPKRLSEALEPIVKKALAKRPADRYDTLEKLARELHAVRTTGQAPRRAAPSPPSAQTSPPQHGELLPKGERRQATLVVSHLDGYAALVEQLVPEAVERVMRRVREEATALVEQHGGVVNQFSEGEMVVVFGIPITHEDDCARATRAARQLHEHLRALSSEIEDRTGQAIRMTMGIDTGLVVAHRLEREDRTYRIVGRALQMAARLAARAEPDEILISPESQRLMAPFFETEARAPLRLKGGAHPVTPYRVGDESEPQSRLEAAERESLTAYTGREDELGTLEGNLEEALQGEGQFVTVEGEAGLGKSRLLYEFRQGLDREAVQLLQGRCQSYGGNIPYLPFIEILRDGLRLREDDPQANPVERVVERVRAIDPELEDFIPLYLHLLSIPNEEYPLPKHLEGKHFRLAMIEALAAIVTLSAKRGPVVMLLEDWHWTDEASREVLRQMAEMVASYPLLIVVTYRPGYALDWGHPARHAPIHLRPLGASSSITVMKSVAGAEGFPETLGRLVHERTGGNPFFLEEVCQTLLEEGTLQTEHGQAVLKGSLEALRLPTTVQAVIRTRMDRMDSAAREVLCVASVIGREFTRGLLQRTLPDGAGLLQPLETLRASGLVQQTRVLPEAAYRFKHVLTQEVAYESLLQHQRKALHGRVGRALEALHVDRLNEYLDLLAHHFSRAEDWQKAVRYGQRAARKANDLSQFSEALQMLENAQQWLAKLPEGQDRHETLVEMLLWQERLCETTGLRGRQQELIDELLSRLEPEGDRAKLAEVYLRQGDLYTLLRRCEAAENALHKSLRIRRTLSDAVGERNTLRSLGLLRWHEGRNTEALAHIEAALSIDRQREDIEAIVGDLSNLSNVLKGMGAYHRARAHLEEALELSEDIPAGAPEGLRIKQAYILHILGNVHRALGEVDKAIAYFQQAVALGARHRLPIQQSYHLTALAHAYLQQGKVEESLQLYKKAVDLGRKVKHAVGLSQSLRIFGGVLHGLGRHGEALPYLQEAAELFAQLEDRDTEALMWSRMASAHEEAENYSEALAAWGRARTLHQQTGKDAGELEALEGIARVTRRHVAEPSLALGYYREALDLAQALENRTAEGRLRNTMGILQWHRNEYEKALAHYERALALFQDLGDRIHEGLMLNSLGVTLKKLGRQGEAAARLEAAIALNRQTEQPLLEGHGLAALAEIRSERGEAEQALHLYERSLDLRRAVGDQKGEGWMLYHLARVHASEGELARTRECATEAATIARACEADDLLEACRQLRNR